MLSISNENQYFLQKKRFIIGENIGYNNGAREKFGEISSTNNGSDSMGLNLENHIDFNDQLGGFSNRAARSAFHANHNLSDVIILVQANGVILIFFTISMMNVN